MYSCCKMHCMHHQFVLARLNNVNIKIIKIHQGIRSSALCVVHVTHDNDYHVWRVQYTSSTGHPEIHLNGGAIETCSN